MADTEKPDCYKCEHRGSLIGDCHSQCNHPEKASLKVVGNPHGREKGWFAWPHNFDPVWLESCDGFTEKEQEDVSSED